ncbi:MULTISPECIES: hypothetical protein [Herbaspirillum]|uniref:Uncharacterized protein n=2 Tax=Herbaspirillum huttiense TaxID=863372 RepID=A0AAJ2LSA5_9BURK|nr:MULTISPECIES: hypothetical protein [Herbaspirillum]MDR9836974.1 hypothetical protein [Herbaspirillum huttiense]
MSLLENAKAVDLLKNSDFQLVTALSSGIFLLVHWLCAWPSGMPWWPVPLAWALFLMFGIWFVLKVIGAFILGKF